MPALGTAPGWQMLLTPCVIVWPLPLSALLHLGREATGQPGSECLPPGAHDWQLPAGWHLCCLH